DIESARESAFKLSGDLLVRLAFLEKAIHREPIALKEVAPRQPWPLDRAAFLLPDYVRAGAGDGPQLPVRGKLGLECQRAAAGFRRFVDQMPQRADETALA